MNSEAASRFLGGAIIAVLALLLLSNVLLWQIVHDDSRGNASTSTKTSDQKETLPTLPDPAKKSTSRELLRELNKTRSDLSKPMQQALDEIDAISAGSGDLAQLTPLLQQLVFETSRVGEAAPELRSTAKRLKTLDKRFKKVADSLNDLAPVLVDLEQTLQKMSTDLARVRECTESPEKC